MQRCVVCQYARQIKYIHHLHQILLFHNKVKTISILVPQRLINGLMTMVLLHQFVPVNHFPKRRIVVVVLEKNATHKEVA